MTHPRRAHILILDRPRLDPSPGRRHGHQPVRPGLALDRLGPPRHGHRRAPTRAPRRSRSPHERLTIHRMGARLTVFPRAALGDAARRRPRRRRRARGRQRHRVLHAAVAVAARAARRARPPRPPGPLRHRAGPSRPASPRCCSSTCRCASSIPAYPVVTISQSSREATSSALGHRPPSGSTSPTSAWSPTQFRPRERAPSRRRSLYLGRLKQYKRIELAARRAGGDPGRDAGDRRRRRPPRGAGGARSTRRGLHDRVTLHGFVAEDEKRELYGARLAATSPRPRPRAGA